MVEQNCRSRPQEGRPGLGESVCQVGEGGALSVEWLIALLILSAVAALSTTAISTILRSGMTALVRADGGAQAHTAANVLRSELSRAAPGIDWSGASGDSLRLRAVRGSGWVCASSPTGTTVAVVYTGDRAPNPAKDSVRIVNADGSTAVRKLRSRRTGLRCAGSGLAAELWDLGPAPPKEAVLRLFESGTYAIDRGALRYRTGRGGRQPVAGVSFDSTSFLVGRTTSGGPHGAVATRIVLPSGPYRDRTVSHAGVMVGRRSLP